ATADEGDFHYGLTPQALLALRLIFGERWMFDSTARASYITSIGSSRSPGTERIAHVDASLVARLFGPHCLGLHYVIARRNAHYTNHLPLRDQLVETVILAYSYVSDFHFGAVRWDR